MNARQQITLPAKRTIKQPFIPEDNEELTNEITRLAGHINAAQYRFLILLGALIEREAWGSRGMKSPAHWLNYYCGIDLGAAREKVRVAKALPNLPKISEAFRTGTISYSKVRAMTRSATPENEEALLTIAQHGTAQHVEGLVRKFRSLQRANDPDRAKIQYEDRSLTWRYDDTGMLIIRGKLPPEEGAAFIKAMQAMQQAIYKKQKNVSAETPQSRSKVVRACPAGDDQATEPQGASVAAKNVSAETSFTKEAQPTYDQKSADTLIALAEQALNTLDAGLKPQSSADKYQVVVHISQDRLSSNAEDQENKATPNHHCTLENGPWHFPLTAQTVKRLCCDTSLITVLEDEAGNPLNIGRKTRTIPPAIRRALTLRDQTCRFPGCCESRFVDAHHIKHWCEGGETKLDNLVLLCRHHHRVLHQEGYEIERREGEFIFVKPDGGKMEFALSRQFVDAEDDPRQIPQIEAEHRDSGLEIDAGTGVPWWGGELMDYDMALTGLMYLEDRRHGRSGAPG